MRAAQKDGRFSGKSKAVSRDFKVREREFIFPIIIYHVNSVNKSAKPVNSLS
jgi:hypothetical protein